MNSSINNPFEVLQNEYDNCKTPTDLICLHNKYSNFLRDKLLKRLEEMYPKNK